MSMPITFIEPRATYRHPATHKYPFCPGCGHTLVLEALNAALVKLQLDPHKVVIVTDIGCVGLSDQYFETHALHGLHGRSVAYATGVKLANPELHVIVLMGDGGCGIGGHHLINAARRNIGVTVLVFNNFNFGMTGGQHSPTTPHGAHTTTTRDGNLERPLDIGATVAVNGAAYVWRGTAFDKDLPDQIAAAITTDGFSLLDIWELCTAYFVPNNDFSRKDMEKLIDELQFPLGVLQTRAYPELAREYRRVNAEQNGRAPFSPKPIPQEFSSNVTQPTRIVIAGAAGGKIKSTATRLAQAAMRCGLWCVQRDDYPVTVSSGHSVSEVIVSPREIFYTGISKPDALLLLAPEGLNQVKSQLAAMDASQRVYVLPELAAPVDTRAQKMIFGGDLARAQRKTFALSAVAALLQNTALLPLDALRETIRANDTPPRVQESLRAVDWGAEQLRLTTAE
jgi:2-oxoglutarate ferredoxin oxidoreductase subunit beta